MRVSKGILLTAAALVGATLLTAPAQAVYLEADAGWFRPWDGSDVYVDPSTLLPGEPDTGYYIAGAIMGGTSSGRARFGGQFEYQNYTAKGPDATLFLALGVASGDITVQEATFLGRNPQVKWETWAMRFLFQYNFMPDSLIQPYLGLSIGLTANRFDDRIYQAVIALPGVFGSIRNIGVGVEGIGLVGVGLQVPGVDFLSFFGEAKFGYNAVFPLIESNLGGDSLEVLNLGGINVGGGVRLRF